MDASLALLDRIAPTTLPLRSLRDSRLRTQPAMPGACSGCGLRTQCLTVGLDALGLQAFEEIVSQRIRVPKGTALYRPGDAFRAFYAIRSGSCKSVVVTEDGREQVAAHHMRGEIVGSDGLATLAHESELIALEDSEVCMIPFERLEELARRDARVQHALHRMLAVEIGRERGVMLMLGAMRAEQRLASFLLDLSRRYRERGYSSTEFVLRMTREEIGSYLGLKLETVSRLFSRFQAGGLVQVQGRTVKLLDPIALKQLVGKHA